MKFFSLFFLVFACGVMAASPVVSGLHGKHPLEQQQVGRLLISELRCMACHTGSGKNGIPAPDLSLVGGRVSPDYLRKFIADPAGTEAGTLMPNLLDAETKREEIAESITHYLVSLAGKSFGLDSIEARDVAVGRNLFHRIGCVSCHSPRDANGRETTSKGVVDLSQVPAKYSLASLSEFLFQPANARPSGRMPDLNLTRAEAKSIASFLIGIEEQKMRLLKPEAKQVASGQKYFHKFNCVACHQMKGADARPALALERLNATRGCLSRQPKGVPNFHLDQSQRTAVAKALAAPNAPLSEKTKINLTLTAFNCIACHEREDYGGVSEKLFRFFGTDEEGLGNEARIPPPLTFVGAKLRPEWMRKVLFDAKTVRPYMHTRMPQFGEGNLGHLPALLERVDKLKPVVMPEPPRDKRRKLREGGHLLVGDKGLNCVACHNFNGKKSPGLKGLDLLTSFERLKPSWFYRFMLEPAKHRPGIVMPIYWPGGQSTRKDILEGDADQQLKALWYYFSLGRSARDPSGIRSIGTSLKVTDTPRVYRGRSRIAGYRGIAVGFPGGVNYAFNAQNGTLSGLWSGEFLNVSWSGQSAGNFNPRARPIELAQDVAFCRLANDKAPWPLRPVMNKDNPVNPDPLYPRNRGYQFKGYQLDADDVPTFLYRTGAVVVEDTVAALVANRVNGLVRKIKFDSPKAETVYFRALTGKVRQLAPTQFATDAVKLWVPKGTALLRSKGDAKELLLKLELPKGKFKIVIQYELLR